MYSQHELKQFEKAAVNTPNLKDYKEKGLNARRELKEGFIRLKDNRVVKVSDLQAETKPEQEKVSPEVAAQIEAQAKAHPSLFNCIGIGIDKATGKVKKGFYQLESGKVISINKLNAAVTEAAKNVQTSTE